MTSSLKLPPAEETVYIPDTFFRATVEQYHRMIDAGVFAEDNAFELLEGRIVHKMAKNRPHTIATNLIRRAFESVILDAYYVDAQEPLTLQNSEPEPDVLIVRGAVTDYVKQPTAADVPLLVEVADATLLRDQGWKRKIYARAGIPVYWIVNLTDDQIEVYSWQDTDSPAPNYRQQVTYTRGDQIPLEVDRQVIAMLPVVELLP